MKYHAFCPEIPGTYFDTRRLNICFALRIPSCCFPLNFPQFTLCILTREGLSQPHHILSAAL